jgi:hypothetical protein
MKPKGNAMHPRLTRVFVLYNLHAEFIEELRRDADHVVRRIVRATVRDELKPPFVITTVVCGYAVDDQIIRLEARVGTTSASPDEKLAAYDRARRIVKDVEGACSSLGLEMRAGAFGEQS